MPHAFISYVRENIQLVNHLYRDLADAGVQVRLDRSLIAPGSRWQNEIRRAMRSGSFYIACFSAEYNNRHKTYMNMELTWAIEELRQRPLDKVWFIPVKLNECEIPDRNVGGGKTLKDLFYVELYKDWNTGIQRILSVMLHRDLPESIESTTPPIDRLGLVQTLSAVTPQQLDQILFALNPPVGVIPPSTAEQSNRVLALLNWAEGTGGVGLSRLQDILTRIAPFYQREHWVSQARYTLYEKNEVDLTRFPEADRDFINEELSEMKDYLSLVYLPEKESLEVSERARLELFSTHWREAERTVEVNMTQTFRDTTAELTKLFCDTLGFDWTGDSASLGQFHGQLIDASNPAFHLNVPSEFPIIYACKTEFSESDVSNTHGLVNRFDIYDGFFALLIACKNADFLRQHVRESPYKNDFIVLSRNQLWEILAAKSPVRQLTNCILEQIDLVKVSPYHYAGPVSEKVFFGRAEEEKTLVQNISQRDYALLANRQMGKTSLLNRVVPTLNQVPQNQVFYCDLQAVSDYEGFYDVLADSHPEFDKEIAKRNDPTPSEFRKLIRAIKQNNENRQIILIFDEVDDLLKYDLQSDERLFKTFRSLSQRDNVRFIFSGTTTLVRRMRHPDSPFFNFCEPMLIGRLDEKAARELVTVPMATLNVVFEDEMAIVERILAITARHPNMIQYTCSQLISRINEKRQRTITETDLDWVINSQEFYDYFESLIWGQATAMEKLIVYRMWNHNEFTKRDVEAEFERHRLPTAEVETSLEILTIYSILTRENRTYTKTFSEFAKLMEEQENIEELAADYQREILNS